MTVASHTSCKTVMFLPKEAVYIALILCVVNSYFVCGFLFLQNLNIKFSDTSPKCFANSISADSASVRH